MEENQKNLSFEEKIEEEVQKRNEYVVEADKMIQAIEQHCQEKKTETESIDVERIDVMNKIRDVVKTKDAGQLDGLFNKLKG